MFALGLPKDEVLIRDPEPLALNYKLSTPRRPETRGAYDYWGGGGVLLSSSLLLLSLKMSDTTICESYMRALLGTAPHFY